MRGFALTSLLILMGCASSGTPPPGPAPEEISREPDAPVAKVDRSDLDRATDLFEEGDRIAAALLADSLRVQWLATVPIDPGTAEDLSELLDRLGAEDQAADFLLRAPFELDSGLRHRLREIAAGLSIAELEALLDTGEGLPAARSILMTELAVALAEANHPDEAAEAANRVLAGSPEGSERDRAEDVLEGRVEPLVGRLRVGVVLPASGSFASVGNQILEGALLALEQRSGQGSLPPVELVIMDDSSRVETGVGQVRTLEEQDVVAVLGPLRTEALASASVRRENDDLLLLSPTASEGQEGVLDVYTLWDRDRRESDVATTLIDWMAREMSLGTFGVLYPEASAPVAQAVLDRAESLGVEVVAARPYASDSTTFGEPIGALAAAEPEAVIVLSDRPRTVLQLAPQLVYYGLRRWVIGGDANWSDPGVVRRLDASYADHRLVATYVDQVSPGTPWQAFKEAYEAEYRKTLGNNMFTALGYDAMRLILEGAPEVDPARRGAIGRAIRRGTFRGATGDLSVDPLTGGLRRAVFVRVIEDGELRTPVPQELIDWAAQQLELEEFLKALEEEEENEQPDEDGGMR